MPNTFKLSTFASLAAMLVAPFLLMPLSDMLRLNLNHLGLALFSTPVLGFLAYRSFRRGRSMPDTAPAPIIPTWHAQALVYGLAIVVVVTLGYTVRTGRLFVPGFSFPAIEGAYQANDGKTTIEFMNGGVMVVTIGNAAAEAGRWSRLDAARIKLEPGAIGLLAQVCGYRFTSYSTLLLEGCDYRTQLSRL